MLRRSFRRFFRRAPGSTNQLYLKACELERMPYFFDLSSRTKDIPGDIVECGVGWGKSLMMLACSQHLLGLERPIYGFDSFEGFPEPHPFDLPGKAKKGHYATSERFVRSSLDSFSSYTSRIKLVKGFVENTLDSYKGQIAILHIDLDIYHAYKTTLDQLFPKVAVGGIIAFDEYQSDIKWPGAKKAVDEFIADNNQKLIKSSIINRYFIVKQ